MEQLNLLTIDDDVVAGMIEALERGNASHPVSWVTLGTYAGLMVSGNEPDQRQAVIDAVDDLLTLGVPVGYAAGKTRRYYLIRSHDDLTVATNGSDPRLIGIDWLDWQSKVKSRLHSM